MMHRNLSPHQHLNHFTPFIRLESSAPAQPSREQLANLRSKLVAWLCTREAELVFAGTIFFCLGMKIAEMV